MFFRFVNVLYREHKYQSTSNGQKSHLCFLIIDNRKTNRGWFGSLFVFPTEWHQTGKQRTAYTEEVVFLFFSYLMLQMKNENRYSGSYFYIPFSVFKVGTGKMKLDYPILIFHYGIGEWKTKGRYIQHVVVFRLSCFHLAKEKKQTGYNGSYFYFSFFVWGLEKRKRMLSYPFSIFYHEIEKRKTKGRYIHGPTWKYCILFPFSQVPKAIGSEVKWAECSLIIGTGCWI